MQTRQEFVHALFSQAIDSKRKARQKANRFLNHLRVHELPAGAQDLAIAEWQRTDFMCEAVRQMIAELAPTYTPPADLRIDLVKADSETFRFESNLDWVALSAAHSAKVGTPTKLGPHRLLGILMDIAQDLYLGATLDATLSQDRLGAQLLRTKCADLRTTAAGADR
jgi:hypothetical protein